MKSLRLHRRALLRGAGGVALGLPWLEAMVNPKRAYAAGPKRFIVFFSPNGTILDRWKPTGSVSNFTLSDILKPLAAHQNRCVFVEGLNQGNRGNIEGPGDDHMKGMAWMLTGRGLSEGKIQGGAGTPAGLGTGISVDQEIANVIGAGNRFRSLEFGVKSQTTAGNPLFVMVYTGPGAAIQPQQNPAKMFDRVFANFMPGAPSAPMTDPAEARRAANRQSVIDAVKDSYTRLRPRVGREDQTRLDEHLAKIRDLEIRIKGSGGGDAPGTACATPTRPADVDANSDANYIKNGASQMDLLVTALSCDLTRVASLQWSRSSGGPTFSWLGQNRVHHDISHDGDDLSDSVENLVKVNAWYAERLAELLTKLSSVKEGDGTMLDNTLVLWCNELAKGNVHSHGPMAYVLAGGAGGALKGGRYLNVDDHHNNLLVSCLQMMGLPNTTFGDPSACTGPLSGLS